MEEKMVRQLLLELAECAGSFRNDGEIFAGAVSQGRNEIAQSPEAVFVDCIEFAVSGRVKAQQAVLMVGDTDDVFHDKFRLFEHIGVQRLKQKILRTVGKVKGDLQGAVDVADFNFTAGKQVAFREKTAADELKIHVLPPWDFDDVPIIKDGGNFYNKAFCEMYGKRKIIL